MAQMITMSVGCAEHMSWASRSKVKVTNQGQATKSMSVDKFCVRSVAWTCMDEFYNALVQICPN